jgi:hypothetical protein
VKEYIEFKYCRNSRVKDPRLDVRPSTLGNIFSLVPVFLDGRDEAVLVLFGAFLDFNTFVAQVFLKLWGVPALVRRGDILLPVLFN